MKYEKPVMEISEFLNNSSIANAGISGWLESSGIGDEHITTQVVNFMSES